MHQPKQTETGTVRITRSAFDPLTGKETPLGSAFNCILDSGVDYYFSNYGRIAEMCKFARIGDGTDPVKHDSGAITASQSGNTVTASASVFVAADSGGLLQWDTGEQARIVSVDSSTQATVDRAQTVASGQFTVHYVTRSALGNQLKYTDTCSQGAGENVTEIVAGTTVRYKTTKLFPAETATAQYKEIGYSNTATGTLNGMLVLDAPDTVGVGLQYKITFELLMTYTATAAAVVDGTPAATVKMLSTGAGIIASNGSLDEAGANDRWDIYYNGTAILSSADASAYAFGVKVSEVIPSGTAIEGVWNWEPYIAHSAAKTLTITVPTSYAGIFRSIFLKQSRSGYSGHGVWLAVVFAEAIEKDTDHVLQLAVTFRFNPVYTN